MALWRCMTAFLRCGVRAPHTICKPSCLMNIYHSLYQGCVEPVQVRDVFQKVQLSPIDTYFMIDCINGGKVPAPVDPSKIVG